MSSTQQPNANSDGPPAPDLHTTSDSSTDATIGRFRDAVQGLKEGSPPAGPAADSADQPAAPLKSVVAEQFVLVDSHGERRATLALDADGGPALTLSDANGRTRAAIRLGVDGAPSVVLFDTIGRRRLEVALKADGATGLGLYDETGEGRAELVVSGAGAPTLSLFGPNGKRLAKLPTGRER
ncbi:MAG TPA: hypothetical protein VNE82_08075 [Candidatus Binataceae bacterium]|nr:hypothetical protein [Candidatus Binataceae bacterium]